MVAAHRLALCPACGRQFNLPADAGAEPVRCSCGAAVTAPAARPEDAAVVACSACGAPRQQGEAACSFCGSDFTLRERDLDAVCPRCAARVSRHGRFCHHCALPLTAPAEPEQPAPYRCPACSAEAGNTAADAALLVSRRLGDGDPLHLFACPRCAGLWLDRDVFRSLVERARRGRVGLDRAVGPANPVQPPAAPPEGAAGARVAPGDGAAGGAGPAPRRQTWSYRPCAVCGNLMNRLNYGRRSGVILDVCKSHGAWFDGDELHRVLVWVRDGGTTEAEVRAAETARRPAVTLAGGSPPLARDETWWPWLDGWDLIDLVELVAGAVGRVVDRLRD